MNSEGVKKFRESREIHRKWRDSEEVYIQKKTQRCDLGAALVYGSLWSLVERPNVNRSPAADVEA